MIVNQTLSFLKSRKSFKGFFFLLWVLGSVGTSQAQKYIILTDSTDKIWIGKNIEYFKDVSKTVTFSEISSNAFSSKFERYIQDVPNFGNIEVPVWNRFIVINHSTKKWILSEWNISVDSLSLYYKTHGNKWKDVHSGRSISMTSRSFISNPYVFELPVELGDTMTFYLKVDSFITQYPLTISSLETFIKDSYYNNLFNGLFFGLIFSLIIYNLALYVILNDRNYLSYVIYLIVLGLMMAELIGVYAFVLGRHLHFLYNAGPTFVALHSLMFIVFSSALLNLKQQMPRVYNLYRYVCIPATLLIVVFNLVGKNLEASISNQLLGVFLLLTMSIVAFVLYRRGYKQARFYLVACISFFTGVVIFVLKTMAILPFNFFTHNAMQVGCAIMVIMFSVSLGDRFRAIRRDRAAAEKKLIEMQLNYEKELRGIEQEVQEHTRDQIAMELHDNIGQLLMVMKLQIETERLFRPAIEPALSHVSSTLQTTIEQVRLLSHALSNDFIMDGGLQRIITQEVHRLRSLDRYSIQFETDETEPILSKGARIVAFRIFQEALSNALRHSAAPNIYITLLGKNAFYLQVRDDGKGFDKESVLEASNGLGLKNMLRRAGLAGLQCSIDSAPQKGCVFTLTQLSETGTN